MSNNVSTLGQLLDNNLRMRTVRTQLNDLQTQLSTGKKAQLLSGLGDDAITSVRTRASLKQIAVYQANIDNGTTRIKQMTNVINQIKGQTKNVLDVLMGEQQKGDINLEMIHDFAHDALDQVRDLLNSKDDDRYLLAGADAFTTPLDKNGIHETYMITQFNAWQAGTIDTDTLITNYKATPETTMGYSAPLSSDLVRGVTIRADVGTEVDYTRLADSDGFKKILNSLALLDQMDLDKISLEDDDNPLTTQTAPGADAETQRDNFFTLYEDVIRTIKDGVNDLVLEEQRLERASLQLGNLQEDHTADKNALETLLGKVEDADTAEVATRLSSLQIQLSASYQVTARLGQLTLSNYL